MPRVGPCACPDCVDPENASQWQFVPEPFATEHGVSGRCVCKRGDCQRWCGLKEAKQQPGRRAGKRMHGDVAAVGALLQPEDSPCPPIIVAIDEIWAIRCADFFQRSLSARSSLPSLTTALHIPLLLHRYADLDALDDVARGNKLSGKMIEYAVHGKWRRHEEDANGVFGTWYLPLRKLVQTFGAAAMEAKLAEFEQGQAQARAEAFAAIAAEEEEAAPA